MLKRKPKISILILNYKVPHLVKRSIASIKKYPPKEAYEVIVIENSRNNVGFGAGFNKGLQKAKGEFIIFANPDTEVLEGSIDSLVDFLKTHNNVGMASSLLISKNEEINPLCASKLLTPLNAFLLHSKVRKLFIHLKTVKTFFISISKTDYPIQAEALQTAFCCVRRDVFLDMGGFDDHYFLFFEEYDLAQRFKKKNLLLFIIPKSLIIHSGGESMKKNPRSSYFFRQSRFYYFQKYYGYSTSVLLNLFL